MKGLGTLVNVLAIIVAGGIGVMFRGKLMVRFQKIVVQAVGLSAILVGFYGAWDGLFVLKDGQLETTGTLLVVFSLLVGWILGEALNIEQKLDKPGAFFKRLSEKEAQKESERKSKATQKKAKATLTKPEEVASDTPAKKQKVRLEDMPTYNMPSERSGDLFVDGFVIATLICAVNAMGFAGAMENGLAGDTTLLFIKSAVDALLVFALATVYGSGAAFAALPVLLVEGLFTILALTVPQALTPALMGQLSLIASITVIVTGVNLCFGKRFRAANLIPCLFVPVVYHLVMLISQ